MNWNCLDLWLNMVGNALTIIASSIAIIAFLKNFKKISEALDILLGYSTHLTLIEIKFNLERMNDNHAGIEEQHERLLLILSDIRGQIKGSRILQIPLNEMLIQIDGFMNDPVTLNEYVKRTFVSELRGKLSELNLSVYNRQENG